MVVLLTIGAEFPHFTLKTVEHSRYLPGINRWRFLQLFDHTASLAGCFFLLCLSLARCASRGHIVSCYEPETLKALLARTQAYLFSGGRLLIHVFALYADRGGPHNAALFLFGELNASAQTQAYTVDELGTAMQEAGYVEVVMQPFLPDLTFLVNGRKP